MKITVAGFGHFATTVATALALRGHDTAQYDLQPSLIRPGQMEKEHDWPQVAIGVANDPSDCDLVWMAYDTPLTETGRGDVDQVVERIAHVCTSIPDGSTVVLSSQWPVGTTNRLSRMRPGLVFVYVVENIRVGHALNDFLYQPQMIVGTSNTIETWRQQQLEAVLLDVTKVIEWMSIESAEMSKHALNAFLALQIAFVNEIDRLGAIYGADGGDVYRALISDPRVSPKAPLKPGHPFGGGSLERDVITLNELAMHAHVTTPILSAILPSNRGHRS